LWALALKAGAAAAAAGTAIAVYGAYGDPHPKAGQESAVPFLVAVVMVVSVIVFGLLVPRALRAVRDGNVRATRWGLASSAVALALTPVAFWSGVPLVVGTAGMLLGADGRRRASAGGAPAKAATAALVIGLIVVAGSIVATVLGNTLLARP
jgi:hypothetical protein